jgi:hypothetical protein
MGNYAAATLDVWDRGFGAATDWRPPNKRNLVGTATTTPRESNEVSIYIKGAAILPRWFEMARDALNAISALPADWNSYAAQQIEPTAVTGAVEILLAIMGDGTPLPTFVPVANGGVLLEWHTANADLEIAVLPNGRAHVVFEKAGAEVIEKEGLPQELVGQLKAFLQGI